MSTQTIDVNAALADVEHARQSLLHSIQPLMEQLANERKQIDAKLASLKMIDRDMRQLKPKIQSVAAKPTANGLQVVIQKTREAQKLLNETTDFETTDDSDNDDEFS